MGMGDSAGLLFRIKSDYDAKGIKEAKSSISGLDASFLKMTGSVSLGNLAADLLTNTLFALKDAAIAVATGIFDLAKSSAIYGSEIYNVSVKTGLSAEAVSALKVASERTGVSMESLGTIVGRFSKIVGEASQGSKTATETLTRFGIDPQEALRDLDVGLGNVFKKIMELPPGVERATAAQQLFGKAGTELLKVLDDFDGDLPGLIEKCKNLGLTLSEEDTRAADEFGDTLDTLGMQATAVGRQFVNELMPMMTSAMSEISRFMAENKDVAREWGQALADAARGSQIAMVSAGEAINSHLNAVTGGFNANAINSDTWATRLINNANRVMIAFATLGMSEMFRKFSGEGAAERIKQERMGGIFGGSLRGGLNIPDTGIGSFVGAGGGGGGGGAKGAAPKDTEFEDSKKRELRILEEFKAGIKRQKAEYDLHLEAKIISERQYAVLLGQIKLKELEAERDSYETILGFSKISEKEREEIEHKLGIIRTDISTQNIENTNAVLKVDLAALKAYQDQFEKDADERKKIEEAEIERVKRLRDARQQAVLQASKDEAKRKHDEKMAATIGSGSTRSAWDDLTTGVQDLFDDGALSQNQLIGMTAGIDALRGAFEGLGQAVGQVVQAWVLYGSAGASVRQVTAQILASVAQQAAVKAIFELAEGFAALAMSFLGIPNAGPSAAAHFKAAAIYGVVAGVAAVAGRAVAGDSFSQASGGGGSGGGASGNSSGADRSNASEPFRGFGQQLTMAIASLDETTHKLATRIESFSPGDVVGMGAADNPGAIRGAYEGELDSNPQATGNFMRRAGNL